MNGAELVGGDRRCFLPTAETGDEASSYNDNEPFAQAIEKGYRNATGTS